MQLRPELPDHRHAAVATALLIAALALLAPSCADEVGGGPTGGSTSCVRHSDCPDPNARCVDGRCEVECVDSRDCERPLVCEAGLCVEPEPEDACRTNDDCPFGMDCFGGQCAEAEGFCQRNADCPEGQECSRETLRCIVPQCRLDADCPEGQLCDASRCVALTVDDAGPDTADVEEKDVPDTDTAPPDDVPNDTPDDVPNDVPNDVPDDVSHDAPEDADAPEDVPTPDASQDVSTDAPDDVSTDVPDDPPSDAEPDVAEDPSPDTPPDAEPDVAEDTGPPPTPDRGVYQYTPLPIGAFAEAVRVAFHPSGDYAVIVERTNVLHVVEWATRRVTRLDLRPGSDHYYWKDFAFDPTGTFALLVGHRVGNSPTGVVFRFEDAGWRAFGGGDVAPVVHELPDARRGGVFSSVVWPWDGGLPVIQSHNDTLNNPIVTLRDFDPAAGNFGNFVVARNSGALCDEIAWAKDQYGNPGILVVCGSNGADVLFYHWVGGVGEWVVDPGNNNLGNTSRVAAYPGGAYALIVSWSGRAVYRFQDGSLNGYSDAPRFSRYAIWGVRFQQEGQRALIFGGNSQSPLIGTVFEYRHDLYRCPSTNDCELTDVSIPGFGQAPWLATTTTRLNDAAFRPGCDGGLLVGGRTDFQSSTGLAAIFQIEGARPCN